jgi:hypothetical protein
MRSQVLPIIFATMLVSVGACAAEETAHVAVSLQPPYSQLPPAPSGTPIEPGARVALDARQQEAVVAGVGKWMKDPGSAQYGPMASARNNRGTITVCGYVNGRNGSRAYVGMAPYIGVLMGTSTSPDFVVVGIGGSGRERAEVMSLCAESGAALAG